MTKQIKVFDTTSLCSKRFCTLNVIGSTIKERNLSGGRPDNRKIIIPINPFERIKDEIFKIGALANNWDGYGSIAVHKEIIKKAISFIPLLDSTHIELISDCFANPNGTLSIEWSNSCNEKMQLEIGLNSFSYFVKLKSTSPILVNESDLLSSVGKIKIHLDLLTEKTTS